MTCSLGPPGSHMASPQNNKAALPTHHSVPRSVSWLKHPIIQIYICQLQTQGYMWSESDWLIDPLFAICLKCLFIWESWGQVDWHLVNTSKLHASLVAWWQKDLIIIHFNLKFMYPTHRIPTTHPNNIQKEIIKCRGCLRTSRSIKITSQE
jgi:hypothetical protein